MHGRVIEPVALVSVVVVGTVFSSIGFAVTVPAQDDGDSAAQGSIEGDVTNETNTPLPGASVRLEDAAGSTVARTTADSSGSFTFSGIAPGEYTLVAAADGVTGRANVTVSTGEISATNIVVVGAEPPTGAIEGDVTNETNTPLPGASVRLEDDAGSTVARTTADSSARFNFSGVLPGEYTLVAAVDGQTGRSNVTVVSGRITTADIVVVGAEPSPSTTRQLNSLTVQPGGESTVTVTTLARGAELTIREEFRPAVANASVESVSVDEDSVTPVTGLADSTGVVVTVDGLNETQSVAVTYTVAVPDDASTGTAYTIQGTATGDVERSLGSSELTVQADSPLSDTIAGDYDADNDGDISRTELSQAVREYLVRDISIADLLTVTRVYAST